MAFSLRKNSNAGTIGLDIDGRYLAAAQVHAGRVLRAASVELPEGLVRDGEVSDAAALADTIKSFVSDTELPRNVRIGVTNQQIVVRVIDLPRIEDPKQRDAAVRFQAAEAIAMPLDEAVLDHQVAGYSEGHDGNPAHAGRRRRRAAQDDRRASSRRSSAPGSSPRASISTPSRSSVRSSPRAPTPATTARASTATSAESPTLRSPSDPPASSPGRCRRSGTTRTRALASPTRSGCRSTTT